MAPENNRRQHMSAYAVAMWRFVRDETAAGGQVPSKLLYHLAGQAQPGVRDATVHETLKRMRQSGYLVFHGTPFTGHYTLGPLTPLGESRTPARSAAVAPARPPAPARSAAPAPRNLAGMAHAAGFGPAIHTRTTPPHG